AADAAPAHDLDIVDVGGMQGKDPLDPFAEADLAHGEGACDALAVVARDADAFVVLHAGAGAFGGLETDADGITGAEVGNGLAQFGDLFRLEFCDNVHRHISPDVVRGVSALLMHTRLRVTLW